MADLDLIELAGEYRVGTAYTDWRGRHVEVPPDTIRAVLAAMDVDASSPASVRAELRRLGEEWSTRLLPPVVVHPAVAASSHRPAGASPAEPLRLPAAGRVWVELDGGGVVPLSAGPSARRRHETLGRDREEHELRLPPDIPVGWHRLHAERGAHHESAALLVAPRRLEPPAARAWGLMAQLYSVRSEASWGLGDLRDLADLATWSGDELGAGFVLINPLHATEPVRPIGPSPYFPMSRRFAAPLYLRVEDVPEYAAIAEDDRRRVDGLAALMRNGARGRGDATGPLDRDSVWAAKLSALEILHRGPRTAAEEAEFAAFRAGEGAALTDFVTWCALAEEHGADWRDWPAELRDPRSPSVAAARDRLAGRVDLHAWLQWRLDGQLGAAQRSAREAGMAIGVVHDLAVGVHPGGADAWTYRAMFASGMRVGAPPDEFNQRGQDWGQPPWHPGRLAAAEYGPYREILAYALRHAGGLRLDHAMQVSRLWWIPEGAAADQGTYVGYDRPTLLDVLCSETARAGAVLIGEDLGVVEPGFREDLAGRGAFTTSLLWFERDERGAPLPPERWRELCLATVGTHDMPPITGFLHGDHIELRNRLGLLTRPVAEELAEHERALADWIKSLTELGLLELGLLEDGLLEHGLLEHGLLEHGLLEQGGGSDREIVAALHAFLARTPARLIGISLADAVGERRTQNQPGTTDEYPNWRVPLADAEGRAVLLEDLRDDPDVRTAVAAVINAVSGREPRRAGE
ncbi:4-alpha-glucanotransferase [Actinomadura alba]|uniref:4-alpha-glucanotransferase n=1 Tax=Actinomadura alba TaxID=406431 RepID=A0ABR7LYT9_9ACTN|nr:4-alpha-glucanotransferase [Actinomadura alba]MBC6470027.1 4-alpha-glucanotransferase [Actinomadura alba]